MRSLANTLQGVASQPSGNMGFRTSIRPGTDSEGWGSSVPASQQSETTLT